jgi:hypothetical protein
MASGRVLGCCISAGEAVVGDEAETGGVAGCDGMSAAMTLPQPPCSKEQFIQHSGC